MVDMGLRINGQGFSSAQEDLQPEDQGTQSSVARVDQEELWQAADHAGPLSADSFGSQGFGQEPSALAAWPAASVNQPNPPTEVESPWELSPQMLAELTELMRGPVPVETASEPSSTTAGVVSFRQPTDRSTQFSVAFVDQEELWQAADHAGPLSADSFGSQDFGQEPSALAPWPAQPNPPTEVESPWELSPQMLAELTELMRGPVPV
ncbi:hypothetical protein QN224_33275, partial [Sinorhizobium sp. 8-89]|nr:hypothetical protein [Sinorhizobium sp. 7-81]